MYFKPNLFNNGAIGERKFQILHGEVNYPNTINPPLTTPLVAKIFSKGKKGKIKTNFPVLYHVKFFYPACGPMKLIFINMVNKVPEIPAVWLRLGGKYSEVSASQTPYMRTISSKSGNIVNSSRDGSMVT